MIRKLFLPSFIILVGVLIYVSPEFKEITAGVAILLFGMMGLENGFKNFTEGPLRRILLRATNKFYKSFSLGLVSTAILQSSSLISVIAISFIGAGLLGLKAGIGIIFGSNVGTTATAWLVATLGLKVNISAFAMPMLVIGVILIFQNNRSIKGLGNVLAGIGFLFLGIHYMKVGFDAFKDTFDLAQYSMEGFGGLLLYTAIGVLLTVILQSSSAAMSIILTALAATQITYFNALALSIGANIGTTITAVIGAAASNSTGRQLAGAHFAFNMVTGIFALALINPLSWGVDWISDLLEVPSSNYLIRLALFHSTFNVMGVLIMLPFIGVMVRILERIFPTPKIPISEPKYLSKSALNYPTSAISALINETHHLLDHAFEIFSRGLGYKKSEILVRKKIDPEAAKYDHIVITDVERLYHEKIKSIYSGIIEFATKAQAINANHKQIDLIYRIKESNRYIVEAIKELNEIQPNLSKYLNSNREAMRDEYDKFRFRIVKVLRQVFKAQLPNLEEDLEEGERARLIAEHIEKRSKKFKKYAAMIKEFDVLYNGVLENLIREGEVTSDEASSLLNDSATVANICQSMLKAAELLYMEPDIFIIPMHPLTHASVGLQMAENGNN